MPRALALAAAVVFAGLAAWILVARPSGPTPAQLAAERARFVEKTGVRPVHVALTGGGGLIDLRYQVVDVDKALTAHDPARPPSLVDEASDSRIDQPWMGHAHARGFHAGTSYFELLINAGGRLERGDRVTLVMGDARLGHLRVE
jgi:hypothetical protein